MSAEVTTETCASWIVADVSGDGEARLGHLSPSDVKARNVETIAAADHATFTGPLLDYACRMGLDLRRTGGVFALALAPGSETGRIARSRWFVTRASLRAILGGPVVIINDAAAIAWSLLEPTSRRLIGASGTLPSAVPSGRWLLVLLNDGVGAAALWSGRSGIPAIIDSEAGHIGFSPANAAEFAIMEAVRGRRAEVSWEDVIKNTLDDPRWPSFVGAFVANAAQALGTWSGVVVTGRYAGRIRSPGAMNDFNRRLAAGSRHGRTLSKLPCSILPQADPLVGCSMLVTMRSALRLEHQHGQAATSSASVGWDENGRTREYDRPPGTSLSYFDSID